MCGISVALTLDTAAVGSNDDGYRRVLEQELRGSLDSIKHRGPDARGLWISENGRVALGHVRLALNDLTVSGTQPFHDSENDVHVVVNGEFYGYDEIRSEFVGHYNFQSTCDSELAIALYLKYGTHFLSKLRGEFALVLYDGQRQLLLAARDRYGVKPLFWTVQNSRLLIASEAKAFLSLGWKPDWDVRSIVEDGWLHDERTLFKNVSKIRPGHYMTCLSFGHVSHREYWDLEYPDKRPIDHRSEAERVLRLRELLVDAVKIRLQTEVSVGIYLSGGIDSAIIAGIAKYLVDQEKTEGSIARTADQRGPLVCFGVGFEQGTEFDETSLAKDTADFLGLQYISKRMDEAYLTEHFETATFHSEHHNPDLNYIAKFALSELPKEHGYKVVLSGEGSDEHFGGYAHFLPDYLREPDPSWPGSTMSPSERLNLAIESEQNLKPGYKGIDCRYTATKSPRARRMLNDTSIAAKLWTVTLAHFAPWTKIYGGNIQDMRALNPSARVLKQVNESWHPLHTSQYVWAKSILPNLILTCMGDRMEMAHSIEGRPPFLDHHLTEYINYLPPTTKIRRDDRTGSLVEKWILREAGKPFISETMYRRTKHPFTAPNEYPVDGPLHRLLKSLITEERVEDLGFVDWSKAKDLLYSAFHLCDPTSLRFAFVLAQWIILGIRFGVKKAECLI